MKKLLAATLLALLIPMFWVVGAKAQTSAGQDHNRYWSESADQTQMRPQQRQTYSIRQDILNKADQMKNLYRMMPSNSAYLETAKGLIEAAEAVRRQSDLTSDYYTLESHLQKVTFFHSALRELRNL